MKFLFFLFLLPFYFSHSSQTPYQVQLVSSLSQIQKEQTFFIGLKFSLSQNWYTYWSHPGDAGLPLELKWKVPKHIKIDSIKWPRPERISYKLNSKKLYSFGYKTEVLLPIPVKISKNYNSDEVPIELELTWFVCKDICITETDHLFLNLKIGKNYTIDKVYYPQFTKWEFSLPQPLSFKTKVISQDNKKSSISFYFNEDITCLDLFPQTNLDFDTSFPQRTKQTKKHCVFEVLHSFPQSSSLKGLLVYKKNNQIMSFSFKASEKTTMAIMWFILLAFLGGLILNIMPCVIPIIFLKIYSTLETLQKNPRNAFKLSLSYAAGVISSFILLAFFILISKSSGEAIGWGFHLQSPLFVTFLAFLFLLMGFYLLQFISIPLPQKTINFKEDKATLNFLTGILSTLAASPCTVPFMAPAVGFAFSRSSLEVFVIFFFLGLGLSFPYIFISIFPQFFNYLPKPRRWMETFKKLLSIPLFLTSLWLFYILSLQITSSSFITTLIILPVVILSILLNHLLQSKKVKKLLLIFVFILVSFLLFSQKNKNNYLTKVPSHFKQNYNSFSVKDIELYKEKNNNIFVYVGAEWCLTCKWNEVFLKDKRILQFFKDNKVKLFYGDWTYRNPEITRFLEKHQRRGVPFYIFYRGRGRAHILRSAFTSTTSFLEELESILKPFEKRESAKQK